MKETTIPENPDQLMRPEKIFPLIRHFSSPMTRILLRLPVTPNQISAASLVTGLACAWFYLQSNVLWQAVGALFLIVSYVLDNCDGEVARQKGMESRFGEYFDTFIDWIVHSALFAALGVQVSLASGQQIWLWLGLAVVCGGTVNYVLGFFLNSETHAQGQTGPRHESLPSPVMPVAMKEKAVFILRELFRADFCFILLLFTLFDAAWVLLPIGAIGAQVYWVTAFFEKAREYHV